MQKEQQQLQEEDYDSTRRIGKKKKYETIH